MNDGYDFVAPPSPDEGHSTPGPQQPGPPSHPAPASSSPPRRRVRRRASGRWVFIVMIAAAGLILGGVGWASVLTYRTGAVTPAALGTTGSLHSAQVVGGMCLKEAPNLDAAPAAVNVVECDQPHHAEALISYTFTTNEWPGSTAVRAEVMSFCAEQLRISWDAIPLSQSAPAFAWHAWLPTAATWDLGDHTGLCVVTTERPVVGSYGAGTAQDATTSAVVG